MLAIELIDGNAWLLMVDFNPVVIHFFYIRLAHMRSNLLVSRLVQKLSIWHVLPLLCNDIDFLHILDIGLKVASLSFSPLQTTLLSLVNLKIWQEVIQARQFS